MKYSLQQALHHNIMLGDRLKKIIIHILPLIFVFVCSINFTYSQQININRIEQMPNKPTPYLMRDWKKVTRGYDSLVFNFNLTGQYLPLVWINNNTFNYPSHNSFGLHTVVGTVDPNSAEAINCLPAIIGASLVGVDKSNQNSNNYALMAEEWFNKNNGELVYLNHPDAITGDDWWYETMPNVFFYQLYDLYPNTGDFTFQFSTIADRWLQAVNSMGGSTTPWRIPYMNYRAFNLKTMKPLTTGVIEPEAAGAIAWILYNAFIETGNTKYRIVAEQAMEFLNGLTSNPAYELQLSYGVYAAARMNAELGTNYNIQKLINWCFDIGPLRQWGTIVGTWGGYDVDGLIGESIDNDYAFTMNTFEQVGALVPLVRYDDRFARAIGKWVLNASNAARLFYTNYLPDNKQDSEGWAHQYDPDSYIAHEALRESQNAVSPYATGDAINGGWGATNLALYGSSHVGILGGIIDTTNVEGILKLDLLKTDYFHKDAYPSYLIYNPYDTSKIVSIYVGSGSYNIYDAVSNTFIKSSVSNYTSIEIPADQSLICVITPSNGTTSYELNRTLVNNIIIDFNSGLTVSNYPPRIKSLAAKQNEILIDSSTTIYCTAVDKDNNTINFNWNSDQGTITGSGQQIKFTAPSNPGLYIIKCKIDDGNGGQDSAQVTIKVVESFNSNPIINKIEASPRKIDLGKDCNIICYASDPENDTLSFTWSSEFGSINGEGNQINWTAPTNAGNYFIKCKVEDGKGGTTEDSIEVSVRDLSIVQSGNFVAYYPFNGNANDESGNGNNGTVFQASLTSDRFKNSNSAYSFDGVNDNIQVTNSSTLNFQDAITLNFWIKIGQFYDREQYPISHGNWENRWKISITNKKIRWTIKTTTGTKDLDSETELKLDSLYNVTAIYSGSDFEIYINGKLDAFTTFSGKLLTTTIDLMIGQVLPGNTQYNFKGVLDDIRIYDYAIPYSEIQKLYDINTDVAEENNSLIPTENFLYQNYPNPFNGQSVIKFNLVQSGNVNIEIYDILGRKIRNLLNENFNAGFHSVTWDAKNDAGAKVASGIYVYELKTSLYLKSRKMILLQ